VAQWEQTGDRPAVAAWAAEQLATFLGAVGDDSLFAFWWLTALRGLRRGELCGLHWTEIDLDQGTLTIERNRTTAGYQIVEGDPKTPAGRRTVALDKRTVQVLRAHRRRQLDQRAQAVEGGQPWTDTGYVVTRADGLPINPNYATTRFRKLVQRTGLPSVRLHDLRHGAASLAPPAPTSRPSKKTRPRRPQITADTYTTVLHELERATAEAAANLVPRRPPAVR
jgi:integrase